MDIKKIIGDNVRGHRKKLGWTQEKLGVRADLSSEYLSRLEKGKKNASAETLYQIAKTLKIEVGALFIPESYK